MSYIVEVQAYQIGTEVPDWAIKYVSVSQGVTRTLKDANVLTDGNWLVALPGETVVFSVSDVSFKKLFKAGQQAGQAFVNITKSGAPVAQPQVGIRGVNASIIK